MGTPLTAVLDEVAPYRRFLTVDEIDRALHDVHAHDAAGSRLDVIGESRAGHPLRMLSIGRGSRHALVLGMPHPNEPTGALAGLRIAQLLTARPELLAELGLVWHIVPCADPDGSRLNEAWFDGPYTASAYAARMYRPPFDEQFEWTFHRDDLAEPGLPPTPESAAVAAVIDDVRPELVASLHNAEVGGLFCYVTDEHPSLVDDVKAVSAHTGVRPDLGPPEDAAESLGPGVYRVPPSLTGAGMLCSTDYAAQYGAFGLTSEPPLWSDEAVDDEHPLDHSRAEEQRRVAVARGEVRERHRAWLDALAGELDLRALPRGRAVLAHAQLLDLPWPAEDDADGHRPSTVAYRSSLRRGLGLERMRAAGHVRALLDAQSLESLSPRARDVLRDARGLSDHWSDVVQGRTRFVGTTESVRCHVGLVLAAATGLTD